MAQDVMYGRLVLYQPEFFDLSLEGSEGKTQHLCCFSSVSVILFQHVSDVSLFKLFQGFPEFQIGHMSFEP